MRTILVLIVFAIAGCSSGIGVDYGKTPAESIAAVDDQVASDRMDAGTVTVATESASDDLDATKYGRIVFLRCRACHSTDAGGSHKVGPNLYGIFGAKAGGKEGFAYSEALLAGGITWNEEAIDAFLRKPAEYVPGTIMAFEGLPQQRERQALISYLKEVTR